MRNWLLVLASIGLAACSKSAETTRSEAMAAFDVASPAPVAAERGGAASGAPQPIHVSVPQIAYVYGYSFILPGAAIAGAQEAHIALCDRLGVSRCQVLAMTSNASDDTAAKATLKLRVASALARTFGTELEKAVGKAGGRSIDRSIQAEDISKDIVDTTARLKQRELLVARLTEILRTRQGKVAELVEAERSVAAAQEEIDQARSWLAELQGRVALSTIDIGYLAIAAPTAQVGGSLGDAVAGSASGFVVGIGAILRLFIYLAPWALIIGLAWLAMRGTLSSLRRRRGGAIEQDTVENTPPS